MDSADKFPTSKEFITNDHETHDFEAQLSLFASCMEAYQYPNLPYHNWDWHITTSFIAGMEIYNTYQKEKDPDQPDADPLVIGLAILGHDAGYSHFRTAADLKESTGFESREEYSCYIAEQNLINLDHEQSVIDQVKECIMATQRGVSPTNINQRIVRRADLNNVASNNYEEYVAATLNFRDEIQEWDRGGEPLPLARFIVASWLVLNDYMNDDEPLWPGDKHPTFSHSSFFVGFYLNMHRMMKENGEQVVGEVSDFIKKLAGRREDNDSIDQEAS